MQPDLVRDGHAALEVHAGEAGVTAVRRDVFLDAVPTPEAVAYQFERLKRVASERDVAEKQLQTVRNAQATAEADTKSGRQMLEVLEARKKAAAAAAAAARAAVEKAEALRADADIRAPFTGVVLRPEQHLDIATQRVVGSAGPVEDVVANRDIRLHNLVED